MWVTDGGNNRTGWSKPEYDRLIAAAAAESDPVARFAEFQQAEALLLRDVPIAPIYYYVHAMLIRPHVQGWHPTILDHHPYKHVSLMPVGE
jgi:oligopeptide transport system substrate-binding protein